MKYLLFLVLLFLWVSSRGQSFHLAIGTYTGKESKGIYIYRFNAATGKAEPLSSTDSSQHPSFVAFSPNGKFLYAVNETGGSQPGGVSAYAFDKKTGKLTFLNQQLSKGDHPCYISIDKKGSWAMVGNYSGGNLSAFAINKDGSLHPAAQVIQHTGSSINQQRQEKAHVHAAVFSPDEQYVFSPDLGMDKIMGYEFRPAAPTPLAPSSATLTLPGGGPRHLTFHPMKKYAYLIEELSGTVAVFAYQKGTLRFIQRVATHPAEFKGAKGSADIHVSPDGKFLYASNRGDANTITVFSVGSNGRLQWKGYQSTLGVHPRNFMIDPTGNYLLVANRDTNNIVIFKRNKHTGLLRATGQQISVPNPVCLKMIKEG